MLLISILTLVLGIGYLIYIVIESFLIAKYRKGIKCVIHVNGIRGKSTITRLIDSSLREFNFKVMSKTTGTIPTIIDVNNKEIEIKRFGLSNIREQVKILKKAYLDKVDYLIIECMAVDPSLQEVAEKNILKANITIISNVREDHIGEMGNNKEELAKALSNTTPTNGYLIINEDNEYRNIFLERCQKNHSELVLTDKYNGDNLDTFNDNIECALAVCKILDLDKEKYLKGMSKYKHDYGALTAFKLNDSIFINGLSINDYDSIKIVLDRIFKTYKQEEITILLNNRDDRAGRTKSLLKLFDEYKFKKVIITGSNIEYLKHYFKKNLPSIKINALDCIDSLDKEELILGIGNIANIGKEIIERYKKGEVIKL